MHPEPQRKVRDAKLKRQTRRAAALDCDYRFGLGTVDGHIGAMTHPFN